jgi:hypothetical protein
MTTRTVTGTVYRADGTAWPSVSVIFKLENMFVFGTGTNPPYSYTVTTAAGGTFTATLAVPDTGTASYRVALPDGSTYTFNLADGAATTLESLLAASVATGTQNAFQTLIDTHAALAVGVHGLTAAGLTPFGGFYMDDGSTQVTMTLQDVYYPITSGMTVGALNGVTFASSSHLVIATAGTYKVDGSVTGSCDTAAQVLEIGVMGGAAGNTMNVKTLAATEFITAGRNYHIGCGGFMSCAVGDLIRLGCENETSGGKQITIRHANLTIWRIGA